MYSVVVCTLDSAVLLEVAHFAAVRDAGREVCILRSDNGVTWSEHQSPASDDDISAVLQDNFDSKQLIIMSSRPFNI